MSNTDLEVGTNKWITTYSLIASSIGLFISILTFVFVDGDEFLNNLLAMNLTFTEILLSIFIAGLIYLISRYFESKKRESKIKEDDLINTIQEIQKAQISYCKKAFEVHSANIKRELKTFKEKLEESGIDSTAFSGFNFRIDAHSNHFKNPDEELTKWLNRLERHKHKNILEEIRADNIKERIKNESH